MKNYVVYQSSNNTKISNAALVTFLFSIAVLALLAWLNPHANATPDTINFAVIGALALITLLLNIRMGNAVHVMDSVESKSYKIAKVNERVMWVAVIVSAVILHDCLLFGLVRYCLNIR